MNSALCSNPIAILGIKLSLNTFLKKTGLLSA